MVNRNASPAAKKAHRDFWADVPFDVKAGLDRINAADDAYDQLDDDAKAELVEELRQLRSPADFTPHVYRRFATGACATRRHHLLHRATPRRSRGAAHKTRGSRRVSPPRGSPAPSDPDLDEPPGRRRPPARSRI